MQCTSDMRNSCTYNCNNKRFPSPLTCALTEVLKGATISPPLFGRIGSCDGRVHGGFASTPANHPLHGGVRGGAPVTPWPPASASRSQTERGGGWLGHNTLEPAPPRRSSALLSTLKSEEGLMCVCVCGVWGGGIPAVLLQHPPIHARINTGTKEAPRNQHRLKDSQTGGWDGGALLN